MPNEFTLSQFGEFCLLKKGVNGPDVHMKAAGIGTEHAEEREWKLAVYNNFCATPSAAVVWSRWSQAKMECTETHDVETWVRENWAGIPIRQNRRPARSVPKLTRSLQTLAVYMKTDFLQLNSQSYDEAWKSLDDVYTWGRYVKIKFLETCRRYLGYEQLEAPDIRSAGGWSPRKSLALLYPEYAHVLANKSKNDRQTLAFVHSIAHDVRAYVTDTYVPVSNYELEALLCNYRQTLSSRKTFYVGRTIDSELEYDTKVRAYWGDNPYLDTFQFFGTRAAAFPPQCLGELMGWEGTRAPLSDVLRDYHYIWSDVVYSYNASKEDLSNPVRWYE